MIVQTYKHWQQKLLTSASLFTHQRSGPAAQLHCCKCSCWLVGSSFGPNSVTHVGTHAAPSPYWQLSLATVQSTATTLSPSTSNRGTSWLLLAQAYSPQSCYVSLCMQVGHVCLLLQQLQQRLQQQSSSQYSNSTHSSATYVTSLHQQAYPASAASMNAEISTPGSAARPGSSSSLSAASTSSPRPHSAAEATRPESARSRPASASRTNQQGHSSASNPTRIGRQQQRSAGHAGQEDDAAVARQQQEQLQQRAVVQASEIFEVGKLRVRHAEHLLHQLLSCVQLAACQRQVNPVRLS